MNLNGSAWKPLTGLIDPFTGTTDAQHETRYETQDSIYMPMCSSVKNNTPSTHNANINKNTYVEKLFIYLSIILCVALLCGFAYYTFNNHIYYSLISVLLCTILYALLFIANTSEYIEDATMHKKITYGITYFIFAISTMMLFIIVRNKRYFT